MKRWHFRLIDTGFFRDGTPFAFGETGALHQNSTFPPLISTLQGAIRTALARFQGWEVKSGQKRPRLIDIWDRKVLGDGSMVGQLSFRGPFLEWEGEPLYPLPRTILFRQIKKSHDRIAREPIGWLVPGEAVESDLGKKRLLKPTYFEANDFKGKLYEGWITARGLEQVLRQKMPDSSQIYWSSQLCREEIRVGIKRDIRTHQAEEGHLYTSSHIRPHAKLRIFVDVEGVPADWHVPDRFTVPLGGEGRFAEVTVTEANPISLSFPNFSEDEEMVRFTVSLLTPMLITNRDQLKKGPLADFECLSASLGRYFPLGGWNLSKNRPRPLQPMCPVGSTWYYIADRSVIPILRELHGTCVGKKPAFGYGQICIGKWEESDEQFENIRNFC